MVLTAMYKYLFRWKGSISKDLDLLCSGISGESGDCYYGQVWCFECDVSTSTAENIQGDNNRISTKITESKGLLSNLTSHPQSIVHCYSSDSFVPSTGIFESLRRSFEPRHILVIQAQVRYPPPEFGGVAPILTGCPAPRLLVRHQWLQMEVGERFLTYSKHSNNHWSNPHYSGNFQDVCCEEPYLVNDHLKTTTCGLDSVSSRNEDPAKYCW